MNPNTETHRCTASQGSSPCGPPDRPGGEATSQGPRPATDCPLPRWSQVRQVQVLAVVALAILCFIVCPYWLLCKLSSPAPAAIASSAAPTRVLLSPGRPAGGGHVAAKLPSEAGAVPLSVYIKALDRIWWQESRRGTDPLAARGVVGEHGELGPMQVTPIWRKDVERLTGIKCDPYDMGLLRFHGMVWLMHYGPDAGANTVDDLADMYRMGPTGFAEKETP